MAYILGVDIGTSGTKTVLISEDGTPVASATYEYPLYTPQNGYAEQEPLDWWNASVKESRTLFLRATSVQTISRALDFPVRCTVW